MRLQRPDEPMNLFLFASKRDLGIPERGKSIPGFLSFFPLCSPAGPGELAVHTETEKHQVQVTKLFPAIQGTCQMADTNRMP